MEKVTVQIQTIEDAENGNKIVDRLPRNAKIIECDNIVFGIIESGTKSGSESILIAGELPDGNQAVMQITGKHMNHIYSAFMGAKMRFQANKNKN